MRLTMRLVAATGAAALLAGCSGDSTTSSSAPTVTETVTVTASPSPTETEEAPEPLSHDDVVTYLNKHGFEAVTNTPSLNGSIKESCNVIDRVEPGTRPMQRDREAWVDVLSDTTTAKRANSFVDTLFDACYETGHARRWVKPQPRTTFGNGTWRVGTDIAAGSYRVTSADAYCLWYRLNKMTSGTEASAIIAWGWANRGEPALATIAPGDVAFQSVGCGTWEKVG